MATFKTFWACTACDKNYHRFGTAVKHIRDKHDTFADLDEFTPERQQRLYDAAMVRLEAKERVLKC